MPFAMLMKNKSTSEETVIYEKNGNLIANHCHTSGNTITVGEQLNDKELLELMTKIEPRTCRRIRI